MSVIGQNRVVIVGGNFDGSLLKAFKEPSQSDSTRASESKQSTSNPSPERTIHFPFVSAGRKAVGYRNYNGPKVANLGRPS
jgi:hypothetical protein